MKLFKPIYKDRIGKKKECQHWYISFADGNGKRWRVPAFSNKRASEKAAEKVEELLSCGGILSPDLQRWIENTSEKMRNNLIKSGLIDSQRVSKNLGKPLNEHLIDFQNSLTNTGRTVKYAKHVAIRLRDVFDKCGFKVWGDLDANRILDHLASLRDQAGIGQRTFNYRLGSAQQFCRWMLKERRAMPPSPIEHLSRIQQTEKRRQRRALTLEEIHKLLTATENGTTHHHMTGPERALIYRLALESGLRANELRNLTVSSFDFEECTVTALAGYTKNKKESTLPLKSETAEVLKVHLSNKMPNVRAFEIPVRTAEMIRIDLEAAEIEYIDNTNKYIDFHALRHSFVSSLARAGVHPSVAQALARHSSITLTMNAYTHTPIEAEVSAIKKLPDLTNGEKETPKKGVIA